MLCMQNAIFPVSFAMTSQHFLICCLMGSANGILKVQIYFCQFYFFAMGIWEYMQSKICSFLLSISKLKFSMFVEIFPVSIAITSQLFLIASRVSAMQLIKILWSNWISHAWRFYYCKTHQTTYQKHQLFGVWHDWLLHDKQTNHVGILYRKNQNLVVWILFSHWLFLLFHNSNELLQRGPQLLQRNL